uniref:Rubisco LSMT substrate-binding domain-containing protein n=1 Tax=Aegilops tauschii TaxID=37682 RepID=M8CH47_AEGTA
MASPALSGTHHRLLLPCFLRRLPRPRSRSCSRLRLDACHADTLLSSSGAQGPPGPAACSSASSAGGVSDWPCHADTLLSSSGAQGPPGPAACSSASSAGGFSDWLLTNGLPPGKVAILERPVPCSRGGKDRPLHFVAAGQDLEAGDVAFEVPMSLVVTLERVLGDESVAELLTTNKLSELACLALYLMYEKKQGRDSLWYPYIKELDRQRGRGQLAVESPLLWTESELDYLNGSPMRDEVVVRDEGIRREYNELDTLWFMAGSLFKQYPFDVPTEAFPFEIFKQAFVAVQSCVVHLQDLNKVSGIKKKKKGIPNWAKTGPIWSSRSAHWARLSGTVNWVRPSRSATREKTVTSKAHSSEYASVAGRRIQSKPFPLNGVAHPSIIGRLNGGAPG